MAADDPNGAAVEVEGADIRSALAAAFDEAEKAAAPTETPPGPKAAAEPAGAADAATGKSAKTPEAVTDAAAPAGAGSEKAPETAEPAGEGDKPKETAEAKTETEFAKATAKWKVADREMLAKQTPEAQAFLMRRYKEMEGDYNKKTQALGTFKAEFEPIAQMLAPYREQMAAKNFTPHSLVQAWANVEKRLAAGGDEPYNVITGLVQGYNLDRGKVATALGLTLPPRQATNGAAAETPAEQTSSAPITLPPELTQRLDGLSKTVNDLTEAQKQAMARARAAAEQNAENEAERFRSAKDAKGNLLHPYIDDVEADMLAMMQAKVASRQPIPSMQELYDQAVWANPSTRESLLSAREWAAEQARKDQERAHAAAARKAAVSVRSGAPGSGPAIAAQAERSLREELEASAAEHTA